MSDELGERGADLEYEISHMEQLGDIEDIFQSIINPFSIKTLRYRERIRNARKKAVKEDTTPGAGGAVEASDNG